MRPTHGLREGPPGLRVQIPSRESATLSPLMPPRERAALHCLALLAARFAVPFALPRTRWALAPPFHPYRRPFGPSVCISLAFARGILSSGPRSPRRYLLCGAICPMRRLMPSRRPGSYPALRSREPGLSSAKHLEASPPGSVPRRRRDLPLTRSRRNSVSSVPRFALSCFARKCGNHPRRKPPSSAFHFAVSL